MHGTQSPSDWVCRWTHLIAPGGQVLDLACGGGRHMQWLAAQGHRVLSLVKSMAPHAHLYEYGTRRQPARPVVGEVAARVRREFYGDLVQMVGEVTGADVRGGLIGE